MVKGGLGLSQGGKQGSERYGTRPTKSPLEASLSSACCQRGGEHDDGRRKKVVETIKPPKSFYLFVRFRVGMSLAY